MSSIKARNMTAQIQFRGRGNPPASHPEDAVGNFFPGLEFNFQNVWKRFFVGLEVLEHNAQVIAIDEAAVAASGGDIVSQSPDATPLGTVAGGVFLSVDQRQTFMQMQGPLRDENVARPFILFEWSNLLAEIHAAKGGTAQTVECFFQPPNEARAVGPYRLKVNRLLEPDSVLIKREVTLPGEITESLCSPWQTDYIGCACYYWSSNRPDFVNITDADKPETTGPKRAFVGCSFLLATNCARLFRAHGQTPSGACATSSRTSVLSCLATGHVGFPMSDVAIFTLPNQRSLMFGSGGRTGLDIVRGRFRDTNLDVHPYLFPGCRPTASEPLC